MKKSRFSEQQTACILKQGDDGLSVEFAQAISTARSQADASKGQSQLQARRGSTQIPDPETGNLKYIERIRRRS